jgi:endoglucanase
MSRSWIRRLIIVAALVVLAGSAYLAGSGRVGHPLLPVAGLLPPGVQRPTPFGRSCVRDPADLPPPPPGPDGRPSNYLHTCGSRIYDSRGREVRITGVNWSGMETSDYVPGGLGNRNWQEILDQVAALGYNTIRIPFSSEAIDAGQQIGGVNFALNPDLQGLTGLQMLDRLVEGARARGLKVILDRHQPTSSGRTALWYSPEVPEDRWIADWRMLAARYRGNDTVIGVDLANEPHGPATWGTGDPATDWRLAAERAGNAVLDANPYLLVFVEGIENYQTDHFWWGGNLVGVRTAPVRLRVPNRVVYSPHDYGPYVSDQPWFHAPTFPRDLPGEWDRHWGYIQEEGIAPVVVGEFGGWSFGSDPDGQWQRALLDYLRAHRIGFLVWALNPTWDTGGILRGDWQSVDSAKQSAYRPLLAAPLDSGPTGTFGQAPTQLKVLFRQDAAGSPADQIAFSFRVVNDGPVAIDLSRLELRYWFQSGPMDPAIQHPVIESGGLPGANVQANVFPTNRGRQGYYLSIRFARGSGSIPRYRATGDVTIRFQKPAVSRLAQTADYSFAGSSPASSSFTEWDRVTLYLDGHLAWGQEPPNSSAGR